MRAGQYANLGHDLPHRLGVAAVDAQPGIQDRIADHIGLEFLEQRLGLLDVLPLVRKGFEGRLLCHADLLLPGLLLPLLIGLGKACTGE